MWKYALLYFWVLCLQLDAFSNPKLSAQVKVLQRQLEETKTQIGKNLFPKLSRLHIC